MRLQCEVSTQNLGSNFPASKSTASVLTLSSGNGKSPLLIVSTTKSSNKYQIRDNVRQIHRKFVDKGQATLQLKQPPLYIFIKKAQAVELGSFLRVLVALITGKEAPVHLSKPPSKVKPPVTKLVVESVAELNATNSIFLQSLQNVTISNCGLSRPPTGLLRLKKLTSLTLASNHLTSAAVFADLPLQSLNLSSNQLQELPRFPPNCALARSLTNLVLRNNQLKRVQLGQFPRLLLLDLSGNPLPQLPWNLGLHLPQLRELNLNDTCITYLPPTISFLKLESFKYSPNANAVGTTPKPTPTPSGDPGFPSLVDLAASSVLKYRLPYDSSTIPYTLVWMLDNCRFCYCGNPSFSQTFLIKPRPLPRTTIVYATCQLPIGYSLCPTCWDRQLKQKC